MHVSISVRLIIPLIFCFLGLGCSNREASSDSLLPSLTNFRSSAPCASSKKRLGNTNQEVRGIWISYLEMNTLLKNRDAQQFQNTIEAVFRTIKEMNLNTVIVQVRPFSDAFYPSKYYPWSHIIDGTEGTNPGFDPLKIMVDAAHKEGLRIEAWINPYRVRAKGSSVPLSQESLIATWLKAHDRAVVQYGSLISLNPASTKAQQLIVDGIQEIVAHYCVDGLHIDDYFYPVTNSAFDDTFDLTEYDVYREQGGALNHGDWRRQQVETLIKMIYDTIKSTQAHVVFGISPQNDIDKNYQQHYFDVTKMVSHKGYIDYIAPQIYFGFEHGLQPYQKSLERWNNLIQEPSIGLYVGLASYKVGTMDTYAGQGKNEWQVRSNIIARMIEKARLSSHYKGFLLYRYDHIFQPSPHLKEKVASENHAVKQLMR